MGSLTIILIVVAVYVAVSTLVGTWSVKHTKDTNSFMTAKKSMGPVLVGILMMSEFIGTGSTLGTAQSAYEKGISAAWNVITLGVGYLLYAYVLAPKFQALGEYTISGALARKYGNGIRVVVSLTMIYALTAVNVSMYTGGAATAASLLHIPIATGILIVGAVTILNVTLGGIRGVGYANIIHATFKYLGLVAVAVAAYGLYQAKPELAARIPPRHFSLVGIGVPTLIAWTVGNIGAVFSTQYVIQCISTLGSKADAKKASLVASFTIVPIGLLAAYIGVSARAQFPGIKSVMAVPAFFNVMNPWLAGVAVCGIVAATFVSILACQLGSTALIMKDFVVPIFRPAERHQLLITRILSVVIGLVPIPFALYVPGLLKTLFFARALRTAVAVVALFMFYLPQVGSGRSATAGLLLSVIGTTVWFVLGNPWGIDNIFVAAVIPMLIMVGERLFFQKKPAAQTETVPTRLAS
jgi:solute:Na+ symporter, SSS family